MHLNSPLSSKIFGNEATSELNERSSVFYVFVLVGFGLPNIKRPYVYICYQAIM